MPGDRQWNRKDLDRFLAVADDYRLGDLETEKPHPATRHLSQWAVSDPLRAIEAVKQIDLEALGVLLREVEGIARLAADVKSTLRSDGRIFLCGCGATGRLSLSIEYFCREGLLPPDQADRVIGFMAGGDTALIRSIEDFEDHPEYGERQLGDLGFGRSDLLIASTEGGETPFVIGATEAAARSSDRRPWFLYCNPDEQLCRLVARSCRVLENPAIRKLNLTTGPMALSGSTRMQASTVLTAAIAWAFRQAAGGGNPAAEIAAFRNHVEKLDFGFLADFIVREADIYQRNEHVLYEPGPFGITVLTDTTERAPTFSLEPFENAGRPEEPIARCHLHLPATSHAAAAWERLLLRPPRALDWPEVADVASREVLLGYDFSDQLLERPGRANLSPAPHRFVISRDKRGMRFELGPLRRNIDAGTGPAFTWHLLLKLLLNIHSTLVMARLGRCDGNLMVWVSASNNKLIDRAIRYARLLARRRHEIEAPYETVAEQLFRARETLRTGEPIVLKTVEALVRDSAHPPDVNRPDLRVAARPRAAPTPGPPARGNRKGD